MSACRMIDALCHNVFLFGSVIERLCSSVCPDAQYNGSVRAFHIYTCTWSVPQLMSLPTRLPLLQVSGFGYTPEYASPEILEHGTPGADKQADLWSLGVMLQELITGTLPEVGVGAALREQGCKNVILAGKKWLRDPRREQASGGLVVWHSAA